YKYQFSKVTSEAKERYDNEVNTAEAYLNELISQDIHGFATYASLKDHYDTWCQQTGLVALGLRHLSRSAEDLGFSYKTRYIGGEKKKMGLYQNTKPQDLKPAEEFGYGLYRLKNSDKVIETALENPDTLQSL